MLFCPISDVPMHLPVDLGLLLNPRSRWNRRHDWSFQARSMLGAERVVRTQTIEDIPRALKVLLFEQKVSVLGICGGDGTIHHTINALLRAWLAEQEQTGQRLALPPVLLLRGGTLNMLARALGARGEPEDVLASFVKRTRGSWVRNLPIADVRVLQIASEFEQKRFGFIFGSEMTARCLALYEMKFGGGYVGLVRFLQAVVTAFALNTPLWQEHRYLFEDPPRWVEVDGKRQSGRATVASTIDIKLLGGLICGMHGASGPMGTMRVRMLAEQTAGQIIANLHKLILGRSGKGILDFDAVQQLRLEGAEYSVDGEVFLAPSHGKPIELTSPTWTLPFVAPFPT